MLLAEARSVIVRRYGYVAASLILVALLVGCALYPPPGPCPLYVEAGAAQGVPCLLLLRSF